MIACPEPVDPFPPPFRRRAYERAERCFRVDPCFGDVHHLQAFQESDHPEVPDVVVALDDELLDDPERRWELIDFVCQVLANEVPDEVTSIQVEQALSLIDILRLIPDRLEAGNSLDQHGHDRCWADHRAEPSLDPSRSAGQTPTPPAGRPTHSSPVGPCTCQLSNMGIGETLMAVPEEKAT